MAAMGYVSGEGLGRERQGIVAPLTVTVLPPKRSLDFVHASNAAAKTSKRKKRRGGERSRKKRFADAARAKQEHMKDVEAQSNGVFDVIGQLANPDAASWQQQQAADNNSQARSKDDAGEGGAKAMSKVAHANNRSGLLTRQDDINNLRVSRLEEMAVRNKADRLLGPQIRAKLESTRQQLADAEGARAKSEKGILDRERQKKWMKF
eukprot:jgi/Chlat1/8678/Chrsp88S08061